MQPNRATRSWQISAITKVLTAWREPGSKILLAACPGAGKTICGCELIAIARREFDSGFCLVVAPTVNVKENWHDTLRLFGLESKHDVPNETLLERLTYGESLIGECDVLVVTFAQLAREPDLFAEMLRRHRGLLVADEPHHADEAETFGKALNFVSEAASLRLALTGTPFNTRGAQLSMIDSVDEIDEEGNHIRRALPTFTYSYGEAISDQVCRPVEFITVMGRGEVEYRSLLNDSTWSRVTDLAAARKTDRLGPLLDPDGAFMLEMLETGIKALFDLRDQAGDEYAAMMVIVGSTDEGAAVARVVRSLLNDNPAWSRLTVTEIYHDTPDAHRGITRFRDGVGDIVIAVRMISEGVDIPRLRVGVYATNYLTRLFFIQLIGRFIRSEARLDSYQFAKVIIPAHTLLLKWGREIERMVASARIPDEGGDGGGVDPFEVIGRVSQVTLKGAILRGDAEDDISIARDFFLRVPSAAGRVPDFLATTIERAYREQMSPPPPPGAGHTEQARKPDLRSINRGLVGRIVRMLPHDSEPDEAAYAKVNASANRFVGIRRMDKLTTDDVLERRAAFLRSWLAALYRGEPFSEAA
jgi:superfamily II DNA or RNA helicase